MGRRESDMRGLTTFLFIGFILAVSGQSYLDQNEVEARLLQLQQVWPTLGADTKAKRDIWETRDSGSGPTTPSPRQTHKSLVRLLKRTGANPLSIGNARNGFVEIFTVQDILK